MELKHRVFITATVGHIILVAAVPRLLPHPQATSFRMFPRGWIIEGTFSLDGCKNGTKEMRLKGLDFQRLREKSKRFGADLATAAWPS